jgi:hypothetical protein
MISSNKINCCICGTVKNCGKYLEKVFSNIEKIGTLFNDYEIIVYYDVSTDNTLKELLKYQNKNSKLSIFVNKNKLSPFRTHNIANGRNTCLKYVVENKEKYQYFIMMDFDDVNAKNCDYEKIAKYLTRYDWDGLSFQTSPNYYDIWGLSIYPFCFSYNHFNNSVKFYTIIQKYMDNILSNLEPGKLLPCISAFNGFAIYRTEKFIDTYYDGKIRIDLVPKKLLNAHKKITKTTEIQFIKYPTVDGRYEDCEHRAFHLMAIQNHGAKIMISPEIIFS